MFFDDEILLLLLMWLKNMILLQMFGQQKWQCLFQDDDLLPEL
ncbi:MAG: hypothetical protein ACOZBL_01840 [Patescibacteria group bacterium]